jgi:predicted ArsR family transcriptional regulator
VLPRTRRTLLLLGDDLVADILNLCVDAARSEGEIVKATGAARQTIQSRLTELEARGLLVRKTQRSGKAGRPQTVWSQLAREELAAFGRAADGFVLALIQAQERDQSQGIAEQREQDLRAIDTDEGEAPTG